MSYGDNKHFEHLKLPVTWAVMGIVVVVSIIAALMFLGDRREEVDSKTFGDRSGFDAAAEKTNGVLSVPVHAVGAGTSWIDDYFFAVRENRILKKKVAELSQYRDSYVEMKDINTRYEALLNLRTEPPVETVTARSVSVARGPFNNNRLIDAGSSKRIAFGNPVITDQGLVGRVVGVSGSVSRVLMVTDVNSHVPIMVMRTDARAMMDGDGGGYPKLDWVRGKDSVRKGDQILTSGDGGIFPRGLPVGEAVQGIDGGWRVRLYADRAPIDFVKVLLFKDFSQLPNAESLLRSPPVNQVLPAPAMPKVAANSSASASSGSASASAASSAAKPATATVSSSVAPKPVTPKPVTPKPAKPKPAGSSSSTAPAAGDLRPFVPSSATSSSGGGAQ
ncbi:rod shape-determining protein MreC [Asticcacaulis solisilvae]|uniref:rod shape-determining protein MreC n=1 Tax=Asticcacaulis solisilvae TaxID=1217274 RepID=UPI003FD7C2EE